MNFSSICRVVTFALAGAFLFSTAAEAQIGVKRKKGPPVHCTGQYDPVCARSVKGVLVTYANECSAKQAGGAIIAQGTCEKVKCPPAELTVCARRDGKNANYANACIAEKEGASVLLRDQCPMACADAAAAKQVCAVDEGGKRAEYKSACQAVIAGARVLHNGRCIVSAAPCGASGFRVCAIAANGIETQYANQCLAESANASWLHNGKCKPGFFARMLRGYRG